MTLQKHSSYRPSTPEESALFIVITSIFLLLVQASKADQILDLRSQSQVATPFVLLKDIVSAPETMPATWAEREVMQAPEPGQSTDIPITQIAFALQKYPDMNTVTLRGQMQMTVERNIQSLSADETISLIKAFIEGSDNFEPLNTLDVKIDESIKQPATIDTGKCKITDCRELEDKFHYSFTLSYPVSSTKNETISIAATVKPLRKAWVARHALQRGHVLREEDLYLKPIAADLDVDYISEKDSFVDREISRSLRPDEPVARSSLLEIMCAQKGDIINVRAQKGQLSITLKAKAMTPGRKGEQIICINEQSRKRLSATLVAPKEASLQI